MLDPCPQGHGMDFPPLKKKRSVKMDMVIHEADVDKEIQKLANYVL